GGHQVGVSLPGGQLQARAEVLGRRREVSLLEADAAQAVARPREEPAVAAGEFQRALVALARGRELAPALVDAADLLEERGRARPREALRLLEGGEGLAVLADPRVEAAQLGGDLPARLLRREPQGRPEAGDPS